MPASISPNCHSSAPVAESIRMESVWDMCNRLYTFSYTDSFARQVDAEGAALAFFAVYRQVATVFVYDFLDYRQA